MRSHFRDNIVFIAISVFVFCSEPFIVNAQAKEYAPINFTRPLNLERGALSPGSRDAVFLSHDDTCRLVKKEFGWREGSCGAIEHIVFGYTSQIDNLVLARPNSDGYVKLDDWDSGDREEQIADIWESYREGLKAQGERLGMTVVPIKWQVYPTLNREKSYLYYAILTKWDDELTLNVKATLFDRQGYVVFNIVPVDTEIPTGELQGLVERVLAAYQPRASQSYFDFEDGDKVAAAGAIGVLATLVGVKYGKAATAGLIAVALGLLKKLWFVLLLPFVFLKKLFSRSET